MFQKKEDDLIKFAFGEMDSRESQVFEASLLNDKKLSEEADFYRTVRDDLQSFREVPEMQFSKERLRNAILDQGIQPVRPKFAWFNLLAPVAVASVFAIAFFTMRGGQQQLPNIAFNDLKKPAAKIDQPAPTFSFNAGNSPEVSVEVPQTNSARPDLVANREPVVSFKRTRVRKAMKAKPSIGNPTLTVASNGNTGVEQPNAFANTNAVARETLANVNIGETNNFESGQEAPPLVIIDASQDSGAGAAVATEVANPTNVVIGG